MLMTSKSGSTAVTTHPRHQPVEQHDVDVDPELLERRFAAVSGQNIVVVLQPPNVQFDEGTLVLDDKNRRLVISFGHSLCSLCRTV
jgi:hypothetical protein